MRRPAFPEFGKAFRIQEISEVFRLVDHGIADESRGEFRVLLPLIPGFEDGGALDGTDIHPRPERLRGFGEKEEGAVVQFRSLFGKSRRLRFAALQDLRDPVAQLRLLFDRDPGQDAGRIGEVELRLRDLVKPGQKLRLCFQKEKDDQGFLLSAEGLQELRTFPDGAVKDRFIFGKTDLPGDPEEDLVFPV